MARKILRLSEVAKMTGIPLNTLRYWRATGRGPKTWKLGGSTVVAYEDDVEAWIQEAYEAEQKVGA